MRAEPENLVLQLLRDMRAEMAGMRGDMATKSDVADLRSEAHSLRADVASDPLAREARQAAEHKQTREQIVGLRRAVVEYYTSVIRHGVPFDRRVRRLLENALVREKPVLLLTCALAESVNLTHHTFLENNQI